MWAYNFKSVSYDVARTICREFKRHREPPGEEVQKKIDEQLGLEQQKENEQEARLKEGLSDSDSEPESESESEAEMSEEDDN